MKSKIFSMKSNWKSFERERQGEKERQAKRDEKKQKNTKREEYKDEAN